ncbi:MAG: glycine cleavage system protein GcvH [Bacillota bacterium]|nr:glycine cleavage system protein GcvH [Bacillota bacterium]
MAYPADYKYTKSHEYIKVEGNMGIVGLTNYAQDQLGDIVFVELPEVGGEVKQGEPFGVVESVKAVSDCYSPVGGKVVAVNDKLNDEPGTINADPHGAGWIMKVEIADKGEFANLMDVAAYQKHAEEEAKAGHH